MFAHQQVDPLPYAQFRREAHPSVLQLPNGRVRTHRSFRGRSHQNTYEGLTSGATSRVTSNYSTPFATTTHHEHKTDAPRAASRQHLGLSMITWAGMPSWESPGLPLAALLVIAHDKACGITGSAF